tara:strand:+ start:506 stop:886 length:381 start_codon:yes stop_codon:yes gene_type:complete
MIILLSINGVSQITLATETQIYFLGDNEEPVEIEHKSLEFNLDLESGTITRYGFTNNLYLDLAITNIIKIEDGVRYECTGPDGEPINLYVFGIDENDSNIYEVVICFFAEDDELVTVIHKITPSDL